MKGVSLMATIALAAVCMGVTPATLDTSSDDPHLYYMHFWAVGPPTEIAAGLKDALTHVNVKQ